MKREYQRLNGTQIHARLVQKASLAADASVASTLREGQPAGLIQHQKHKISDNKN